MLCLYVIEHSFVFRKAKLTILLYVYTYIYILEIKIIAFLILLTFLDIQVLETLPDGSIIVFTRIELSFPFTDRDMVLHATPPIETDWFGKKAYAMFVNNATHASKPAGADGLIRANNGGNFYIAVQDEKEPGAKCEVFGLSNNNYNGWIPDSFEFVISPRAAKTFYDLRRSIVDGYKTYFS